MILSFAFLLAVGDAAPPGTDTVVPPPTYMTVLESCIDDADGTSYSYSQCNSAAIRGADETLNAKWKRIMALYGRDSEIGKALLDEQRAWIAFKEKACDFYWIQPEFGSMHRSIIGPSCMLDVINARIDQFDSILINLEAE